MRFINRANLEVIASGKIAYPCINFRKNFSESTDGYVLIRVSNPEVEKEDFPSCLSEKVESLEDKAFSLSKAFIKKLLKVLPSKQVHSILENACLTKGKKEKEVIASCTDLFTTINLTCKTLEGDFPDMDTPMEIAKNNKGFRVTLGISVLEKLLKATQKAYQLEGKKENEPIHFVFGETSSDSIYFTLDTTQKVEGILMPFVK